MASDALIGNMPTEKLITFFANQHIATGLELTTFESCMNHSMDLFRLYQ
jgi:hydroxymethylglutaryl-CoA lyase